MTVAGVAANVLGLIGNTPIAQLNRMGTPEGVSLFAKLEVFNPGGSIKDRICVEMVHRAVAEGKLEPGGTIIEPTAGNTGVGFAIVAASLGYEFTCTMPEKFAGEKADLMKALGARVVLTPTADGMQRAIDEAERLAAETPRSYVPNQFSNAGNPDAHYQTTGPEIWRDLEGRVDVFVAGCGSGGTFTGVARYLKERNPNVRCVAVEPEGSTIGGGPKGAYKAEGIGNWFVPDVMDLSLVDQFIRVPDKASFDTTRRLAVTEGILVGSSSGAACWAALQIARESEGETRIVTVFPDSSERYLSKRIYEEES
jgi:O-acetylserine dependent cystathionine beta-synthase